MISKRENALLCPKIEAKDHLFLAASYFLRERMTCHRTDNRYVAQLCTFVLKLTAEINGNSGFMKASAQS